MEPAIPIFFAIVALGTALATLTIWSRRRPAAKVAAVGLTGALFISGYFSLVELLGRPKPIDLEWGQPDLADATVLGSDMREDEAIYLWLRFDGVDVPRAYVLPWSQDLAQQLQSATRQAEEDGTEVRMREPLNGDRPDDEEPVFYAQPQSPLPPKPA